jgi:hypothetical protein
VAIAAPKDRVAKNATSANLRSDAKYVKMPYRVCRQASALRGDLWICCDRIGGALLLRGPARLEISDKTITHQIVRENTRIKIPAWMPPYFSGAILPIMAQADLSFDRLL